MSNEEASICHCVLPSGLGAFARAESNESNEAAGSSLGGAASVETLKFQVRDRSPPRNPKLWISRAAYDLKIK